MLIICTSCANAYRSDYFVQSIFSMSVKEISMDRTLIINQVEIAFVMPYHWPIHSIPPVTAIAPSFSSLLVSYPRQQEHSPHTNLSWPLMWLYFSFNPLRPLSSSCGWVGSARFHQFSFGWQINKLRLGTFSRQSFWCLRRGDFLIRVCGDEWNIERASVMFNKSLECLERAMECFTPVVTIFRKY